MKNTKMDTVDFAKALADDTRQKIMRLCCCQWLSVNEIVEALGDVTQPTVSHHLNILRTVDLVETRRDGKQVFYTLNQRRIASGCCTLAEKFAPDQGVSLVEPE